MNDPALRIGWKEAVRIPRYRVPAGACVFATDLGGRVPLVVGLPRGRGAALWLAVPPGNEGYERFPHLPRALAELGVESPLVSRRLWAFFDAGVHGQMDDADAVAERWRRSGIAAVHIAVWDFFEGGEQKDAYLRRLIEACHRHLVLAYAWLELPHVSRKFWDDHPEWREKNALLKDAHVDWRLLMNLADPACAREARRGVADLVSRLDWDGVNLAELYFDGIEGFANLREFTPLNDYVRRTFREAQGFDPIQLFPRPRDAARKRAFLDYRIELAARLEEDWVRALEQMRVTKPWLDIVLTHVDDLFDTNMRDAIAADASRAARLLDRHDITLVIEDPATLWHLGPRRYAEISKRYAALPARMDRVGVDINVVPRQRPVFPTAAQTGVELLELIHTAAQSFSRVTYYCESTADIDDRSFLPAAAAVVTAWLEDGERLTVESPYGLGVRWKGPVTVDGRPWPVQNGEIVWLPPGRHEMKAADALPAGLITEFSGMIEGARLSADGVELAYRSEARAFASLSRQPRSVAVDSGGLVPEIIARPEGRFVIALPKGRHRVLLRYEPAGR